MNYGATASFTVTPVVGYSIDTVTGCGGSLNGKIFTTATITADCAVTATFVSKTTYTVTPKAGGHGSITPAAPQQVHKEKTASFIITPDAGYVVKSVSGCGGTLSGSVYTTAPITGKCTVSASFIRK